MSQFKFKKTTDFDMYGTYTVEVNSVKFKVFKDSDYCGLCVWFYKKLNAKTYIDSYCYTRIDLEKLLIELTER